MKTTVVFHSADYDGIFCREIARKFLGDKDVEYIGWNFGDPQLKFPESGTVYVMDLPVDKPFGFEFSEPETVIGVFGDCHRIKEASRQLVWIDHHKTSIDTHPKEIPGYRIDGVAACRLAWQWFDWAIKNCGRESDPLPTKQDFIDRKVSEPLAVRLAGEYDIWDKRDQRAETFQYALRACDLTPTIWERLLRNEAASENAVFELLHDGEAAQKYSQKMDAELVTRKSFRVKWEGLDFICLNTGRFNSLTFAALDKPETGHDALMGFMWNGKVWTVSLYHAKHNTGTDLSAIAVKHGGGGHRGACGFVCRELPFKLEGSAP